MINRICENISNLIYLVGDKHECKLNVEYIDAFITALIPIKGNKDCLSDGYLRKVIRGEVKDIELITLFSIAYSFDISMEKFMLEKNEFEEVYRSTTILPKKTFDLYDIRLKKRFIKEFQDKLNNILKKKLDLKNKSKKYFLYKESKNQYVFEILSRKTNKLPRVDTIIMLLKSIEYEAIDIFMEELYDSWSKEVEIYYRKDED